MQIYKELITVWKIKTIMFAACFAILVIATYAQEKGIFGSTLPWYAVQPWEAEVCAKWGGTQPEQNTVEIGLTPYGDMSMTVQGKRIKMADGKILYEIAYYLESFGATTQYKLEMLNPKTQQAKTITQGTLEPGGAETDYITMTTDESYMTLRIIHDRGVIVVPIVEAK